MVVIDRYIDNSKELAFEEALEELERQQLAQGYTDEEIEEMYQAHQMRANIGNPMKMYGAI